MKTFYLNEKGIDMVGKVVVEFPKRIGMSGDFYIFHFKKDDQWKALYDAMAEKTPIVLSDNDAVFCLRLPNKGSKTVSYETIGSWASLPSPLRMEIDMGLSGGAGVKMSLTKRNAKIQQLNFRIETQKRELNELKKSDDILEAQAIVEKFSTNSEKDAIQSIKGYIGGNTLENLLKMQVALSCFVFEERQQLDLQGSYAQLVPESWVLKDELLQLNISQKLQMEDM